MSKIVIGYDGSDSARRALQRAAELANSDPVTVVSAVHMLHGKGGGISYDPVEKGDHRRHLAETRPRSSPHRRRERVRT